MMYLRSPFRCKTLIRHYVFHDWRYQFSFRHVKDVKSAVSTVLGAMTPETSCTCHFSWHFPGDPSHNLQLLGDSAEDEVLLRERALERGLAAIRRKNEDDT